MNISFQKFDYKTQLRKKQVLFAECFPEVFNSDNNRKIDDDSEYLWQYHSFPGSIESYEYVAMQQNEIIGYYAALPYKYKIGDKIITAGMVCGVMTSPKYRKMGIFTKLGNYAAKEQKNEGVSFNLTFPIRKAVMPGFIRMGWDIVFEMPLYIRFLGLKSILQRKNLGFISFFINPLLSLYNEIWRRDDNIAYVTKIYSTIDDIIGYDDFLLRWNASITNTLIKDKAFMQWRYGSPGKEYMFLCAFKEQTLVGLITARNIIREGVPSIGILDFMVTDKKCLHNLHNAIFRKAKSDKKEAIMMMMSKYSSQVYKLTKNGYLKSPFRFHLIMNILAFDFSKDDLYNEALWHLMFVDSDDL